MLLFYPRTFCRSSERTSYVLAKLLAAIAFILTAFGIMLGIVKPADALRRVGAILGIVVLLMVIPVTLVNVW